MEKQIMNKKRTVMLTVAIFLLLFIMTPVLGQIVNGYLGQTKGKLSDRNRGQVILSKAISEEQVLLDSFEQNHGNEINYQQAMNAVTNFFIENKGQFEGDFQYYAKMSSGYVCFGESKITFNLEGKDFSIEFSNATTVRPMGNDLLQSKSNYYFGTNAVKSASHFNEIIYNEIYEGISIIYRFTEAGLKYDIVVEPYADIEAIQMKYIGFESLELQPKKLELTIGDVTVIDHKLVAWYDVVNEPIAVAFNQIKDKYSWHETDYIINFQIIEKYDNSKRIIIDPLICAFSTYFGGSGNEYITSTEDVGEAALEIDKNGNIVFVGRTSSTNFPVVETNQSTIGGGAYDAFVVKMAADGQTLLFATFLGGTGNEWATDVAIDANGNIGVVGTTSSSNFPTKNTIQATNNGGSTFDIDSFVVKLNSTGFILFSTYWGGTEGDWGYGIAFDSANKILITGDTYSTDFFTKNAFQDTHSSGTNVDFTLTKFSSTGQSITFSTYMGGSDNDWGTSIVVDSDDNIICTGGVQGPSFPTLNAYQTSCIGGMAIILVKFADDGTLLFSTTVDGSGQDRGYEVEVDSSDNIIVVGNTLSSNFPTENATQGYLAGVTDLTISKFSPNGQTLLYSSFFGGSGAETPGAVAIDQDDNIIITGETASSNFPIKHSYQHSNNGGRDALILVIAANGTLIASSYLGGSSTDIGIGVAVNVDNDIVVGGYTISDNYPTENAYQSSRSGTSDMFVSKFSLNLSLPDYTPPPTETPTPSPTETGGITLVTICGLLALIGGSISMANRRKHK